MHFPPDVWSNVEQTNVKLSNYLSMKNVRLTFEQPNSTNFERRRSERSELTSFMFHVSVTLGRKIRKITSSVKKSKSRIKRNLRGSFSPFPWWRWRRRRPALRRRRCLCRKWCRWRAWWRRRGLCWGRAEWVSWSCLVDGRTGRRRRSSEGQRTTKRTS